MIQPHLQYGWQMRSLLGREVAVPDSLLPACNLLYLAEVAPANRLPL